MGSLIGVAITCVMVFGGYMAAGGKLGIIMKALPFELMMIAGAAVGALIVANDGHALKATLRDVARGLKGPRWKKADYGDLLCLLFALIRIARRDPVAVEAHIERPSESPLFQAYPRILADASAVALISDTIRMGTMNYDDPHQLEAVLDKQLEGKLGHDLHGAHALQVMADGLPALGIVAAVLGVIKTMASIDQPPEILGKMIGGALVGTFLGVFLSYGIVGPLANRIRTIIEADHKFYELIRDTMVANMHRHSPQICIEVARQNLPGPLRLGFDEMETRLRATPEAA